MSEKNFIKKLSINWVYSPDIATRFANNFVVQHDSEQFFLSFFDIWMPMIVGETDEEKQVQLNAMEKVDAKCVARIVMSPEKMRELVEVMILNLENYEQKLSMSVNTNETE
jgi:hypothetical protein